MTPGPDAPLAAAQTPVRSFAASAPGSASSSGSATASASAWAPGSASATLALAALSALAVALAVARALYTRQIAFAFLTWNLALAWIPWGLALALARPPARWRGRGRATTAYLAAVFFAWLMFFPNAPYMVTDLVHLQHRPPVPLWYDAILMFAYCLAGVSLACGSLALVDGEVARRFGRRAGRLFVLLVALLSGFGIYLGRFARANTWDVVAHPAGLVRDVLAAVSTVRAGATTVLMAAFLLAVYAVFTALGRVASGRIAAARRD